MYEDIGLLMSTPPQGGVSLTFMLDHNLSLSLCYWLSLSSPPRLFSIPPSLPPPCCTSLRFRPLSSSLLRCSLCKSPVYVCRLSALHVLHTHTHACIKRFSVHSDRAERRPSPQSACEKITSRCLLRSAHKELCATADHLNGFGRV